ncbi:MAG TPA: hypothetical protein VK069_07395, partial [Mycolicibacillus parakoreensis]|nr:hypothetical protein [Mycolicibacillus parakoreensis]
STDSLLRFAIRADATLTGLAGLAIAFAADPIAHLTGLTATEGYVLGVLCALFGLAVFTVAAIPDLRRAGPLLIADNALCTVAAVAVVQTGVLPLTGAGVALVLTLGAATAGFALLQYAGLRRLP